MRSAGEVVAAPALPVNTEAAEAAAAAAAASAAAVGGGKPY